MLRSYAGICDLAELGRASLRACSGGASSPSDDAVNGVHLAVARDPDLEVKLYLVERLPVSGMFARFTLAAAPGDGRRAGHRAEQGVMAAYRIITGRLLCASLLRAAGRLPPQR